MATQQVCGVRVREYGDDQQSGTVYLQAVYEVGEGCGEWGVLDYGGISQATAL